MIYDSNHERYYFTAEERAGKAIYVNEGTERFIFNAKGQFAGTLTMKGEGI